eukprot:COSAG02_NODE_2467_length_8767_cov_226.095870_1_plen_240_part_00
MMSLVKIRKIAEAAKAGAALSEAGSPPECSEPSFQSVGRGGGLSAVRSQRSLQAVVPIDAVFAVGQEVQVWSKTAKLWLPAQVLELDAIDAMVKIKPLPQLKGARPWVHPRGHAPYIDGYDRSAIRPKPKDADAEERDDRTPLGVEWSFSTTFEDIKATKDNDERGWAKVRRIFLPDVVLPGMKSDYMSPKNILDHMFSLKYGPFVKKEPAPLTPGQKRSKRIIARAQANRQRAIERRL